MLDYRSLVSRFLKKMFAKMGGGWFWNVWNCLNYEKIEFSQLPFVIFSWKIAKCYIQSKNLTDQKM